MYVCVYGRVHKSVWDKGVPLLISNHYTQVSPVHIGWQQWRLTVLGLYTSQSLLPSWSTLGGQHAVSGPAINSGPGAACALGGRLSRNLFAIMEVNGKVHVVCDSKTKLCITFSTCFNSTCPFYVSIVKI